MIEMSPPLPPDVESDDQRPVHIRSYVIRAGRMGSGQVKAIETLGPQFVVPFSDQRLDYSLVFGRRAPVILEIGFGMGDATAQIAEQQPQHDFLGIEVHPPGVGSLLKLIDHKQLANLRIIRHDAVEVLGEMIADRSLRGVHIFFPDPWHKKRHHKRRLIQPEFIAQLCVKIEVGGYLHCATDWEHYAEQMLKVLSQAPFLKNTTSGFAPRLPYRPLTKFENRGLRLGHGVWDLVFKVEQESDVTA